MPLLGAPLELLTKLVTDAFSRSALADLVKFKLGVDMDKYWVRDRATVFEAVQDVIRGVTSCGRLCEFINYVIAARNHLKDQLSGILSLVDDKETSAADQTSSITSGVEGLTNSLQIAPVRAIVQESKGVLTELAAKIDLLDTFKHIHDGLHQAKMTFRKLQSSARLMAKPEKKFEAAKEFTQAVDALEELVRSFSSIINTLPASPPEQRQEQLDWLATLTTAVALGRQAQGKIDAVVARQCVDGVRSVLNRQPTVIDGKIAKLASEIELRKLTDVFGKVGLQLPDQAAMLEQSRISSEQLIGQLNARVNQHGLWQGIDDALLAADETMRMLLKDPDEESTTNFDALWKGLNTGIAPLLAVEATSTWAEQLTTWTGKVDAARGSLNWPELDYFFECWRGVATYQFFSVDTQLKELAEDVNKIGTPLRNLLEQL